MSNPFTTTATVPGGQTGDFPITFSWEWLDEGDFAIYKNGGATKMAQTTYILVSRTELRIKSGNYVVGDTFTVQRDTQVDEPHVSYSPGAAVRAQDLNDNNRQNNFGVEEVKAFALNKYAPKMEENLDMNTKVIYNLADADSDDDAVNRKMLGNIIADDISDDTAQGLQINKTPNAGTNSGDQATFTILDSSKTQKGSVTINQGQGIDVTYTNGDAVISGIDSTKDDKGIVRINEAHAIGVTYTAGNAVISADKSTTSQQGVVRIVEQNNGVNGNPVDVNYTADGEVEIGIADDTIDIKKLKNVDVVTKANQDGDPDNLRTDDDLFTGRAATSRFGVHVSTAQPNEVNEGKLWINTSSPLSLRGYDGSGWRTLTQGEPYTPATSTLVRYVDVENGSDVVNPGDEDVRGTLPQEPLQSIGKAIELINDEANSNANPKHGSLIFVAAGVYQEDQIDIKANDVSIVGAGLRSVFVQPTNSTSTSDSVNYPNGSEKLVLFRCNSGTLLTNMTFVGMKASGTRGNSGNSNPDPDATYGLPENQGWCAGFYPGCVIRKSPYIQNCTSFNDSEISNSSKYDPTALNTGTGGLGGDTTSDVSGGGIICDGAVPASSSPLRSFVVDSFTQINLDGPGILCTNNGYAQLVSFFGTFCHYHAKALNGGQLNLSNCTTDFGRYGLIADGKSATNIFTATSSGTALAGASTFTIGATTAHSSWHGDQTNPRPLDNMLVQIGGNADGTGGTIYPILSSTVNGGGYDVEISNPDPVDYTNNLGLAAQLNPGTTVRFFLRSLISTGGHTFEYCGSGTDYSGHPDNGGEAVLGNQTKNLNDGRVWQSSTDENGRFQVGETFIVDQKTGAVQIPASASPSVTKTGATKSALIPAGTTAQRDTQNLTTGMFRYNTDNTGFEFYNGSAWGDVGGVSDGDKGDITVASNGTSWTIDNNTVGINELSATGTADATTFLRGDNSWQVVNTSLSSDSNPQLGANLDVLTYDITTTTSNGNIDLTANGTGLIRVTENGLSQVPIVAQHDFGTASNEIPLNQYLGTAAFQDSDNFSVGNLQVATAHTFATLPSSPSVGRVARVTDSTVTTWGGNVTTGGGSNNVLCWYNGTNWTVIGV